MESSIYHLFDEIEEIFKQRNSKVFDAKLNDVSVNLIAQRESLSIFIGWLISKLSLLEGKNLFGENEILCQLVNVSP